MTNLANNVPAFMTDHPVIGIIVAIILCGALLALGMCLLPFLIMLAPIALIVWIGWAIYDANRSRNPNWSHCPTTYTIVPGQMSWDACRGVYVNDKYEYWDAVAKVWKRIS
jgi:hypothetical protein